MRPGSPSRMEEDPGLFCVLGQGSMRTERTPKKGTRASTQADPEAKKTRFIAALSKSGVIGTACKYARFGRTTAYKWRDEDETFKKLWDEALEDSTDLLEEEARRRAHDGTLKPVYQGGECVGHIREYSDLLIIFLLKARRPEKYRETIRQEITGKDGKPIQIEDMTREERKARIEELTAKRARRSGG